LSSTSIFTKRTSGRSAAISARIGLMIRQGPHQTAWKSTTTGASDSSTSAVKRASVVSNGMPPTMTAAPRGVQVESLIGPIRPARA
jgi:hypothetical protein